MYMGSVIEKDLVAASTEPLILSLLAKARTMDDHFFRPRRFMKGQHV